ncbi:MAG TPA: ABC transporter permease subunit [bacterium]|nr:ABC transporter permease subunit [bacterium]HPN93835.1 ABC transporter permease subunit [bacterium]
MLFQIIRKELLLNLVSFRFIISSVLLFVLIVGSMNIMAVNYTRRLADYSSGVEMHADDIDKINTRPMFEGFGVTRDPRPAMLGIFSIGLDPIMSRSFMVPGYTMKMGDQGQGGRLFYGVSKLVGVMPEGSKYSNPIFTLFQPPDFVYVINIVLSLLAILFAFDAISGEKESQTLKLMLTNSLPRDVILFGKWIGGTISILLPFCIAFGIGALTLLIRPDISPAEEATSRILVIFVLALLYIAVFFLIGLVFSTFSARSSTSLVLSLFAWVLFVLVIPNLAPVISRQFVSMKPADAITRELERQEREMWGDGGGKRVKAEIPEKVSALEDAWLRRLERQASLAVNISRVSPSAAYIYASSTMAGTGISDYFSARDEVLRHRQELGDARDKFVQDDKSQVIPGLYIKVASDLVPEFRDKRQDLSTSLNNSLIDLAILVVYLIALFMVAFLKFLRYDVK